MKDAAIIARVSKETGVSARLIAAVVIPEQVRFFTSEREVFKRYFEPLKILGSLSQFSLGVSGIKQETAVSIEEYAHDSASAFYPGEAAAHLIAYGPGENRDAALYARLTDAKDHYYSYLYTGALPPRNHGAMGTGRIRPRRPSRNRDDALQPGLPELAPKREPPSRRATITTGGKAYPFGVLGGLFYRSNELRDVFPS